MTIEQANAHLVEYIKSKSPRLKMDKGQIADFCLNGDESLEDIEQYADDYLSEIASDEAEYRAHRREMGDFDDSPSLDMNLQY